MAEKLNPPNPPPSDGVVAIRPFRAEDAPAITEACQDPQVSRWIPLIPVPYTEADARRFILLSLQAWSDGSGYEFAIADPATDRYVGSVGIQPGTNPRRHAIGYMVAPWARGRGVATRGVKLAVRWAFENLDIERLALWTLPGNVASQRVAEKAGFRWEGLIRNWEAGRDGHPVDVVMYSMTPEDLEEADKAATEDAESAEAAADASAGKAANRRPTREPADRRPVPPRAPSRRDAGRALRGRRRDIGPRARFDAASHPGRIGSARRLDVRWDRGH